jgi:hypothetical protein
MDGVMNTLTKLVQRHLRRRASRPVYQQLELPLGGVRLNREEWSDVLRLAQLRQQLQSS